MGKYFVDITFFATGLNKDSYDFLSKNNNTKANADIAEVRNWEDWKKYVNGWGRLVFYK